MTGPIPPSLLCPVMVGRDAEEAALAAMVDDAACSRGAVALLAGDAGAGKSRLSAQVAARARNQGMWVLSGRAVPSEAPTPYRPLTEAFVTAFRDARPIPGPDIAGFEGHIRRLVPGWDIPGSGGADESPVLLGEAALRLLRLRAGDRGCLLLLEDLHWADAETVAALDYLFDALAEQPVLVLATTRPVGGAEDLARRLGRRDPRRVITVGPLADEDIERVVAACLAPGEVPGGVIEFVTANCDGSPFLAEELLAGLAASGAISYRDGSWVTTGELTPTVPASLAASIHQRMLGVDGATRRVLGAAALLGRRFDWELLPSVTDLDGAAVVEGLRRGVAEQLIEVDGNEFRFRHALTREAVLDELLPPERQRLAGRALPAVELAHPGVSGPWCELAAELAVAAGERGAAAAYLEESARRSLERGALASAEAAARRALHFAAGDVARVDETEGILVQILALAGQPEAATTIGLPLAARLEERGAPPASRAELLLALARAAVAAGKGAAALELTGRARSLVEREAIGDAVAARVEAVAAHAALECADVAAAESFAYAALDRVRGTDQPAVECEALEVLGRVTRLHDVEGCKLWFRRAADLAAEHNLTSWLIRARQDLALFDWIAGRDQPLREVRDLAARHGALVTVAFMDLSLADFALSAFDHESCREAAQRCVDASRRYGLATLPVAELWLAGGHALAGDDDAMEQAATRALARDPDDPRILGDLWGRVRAASAIVRHDRARLRDCLERQMVYARVAPPTTSIFPNRFLWALVCTLEDDDRGEAARAEVAAADNLRVWPQFDAMLLLLDCVARARAGESGACDVIERAANDLRASKLAEGTVEYRNLLVCETAVREGWGDPATWIRPTEVFFERRGFTALARACRAVIAAAGAPVPRRRRRAAEMPKEFEVLGVTAREHEVLALLVAGLTNREIGERLYLSPRTVERHVASLFDRTGVRTRGELRAYAESIFE